MKHEKQEFRNQELGGGIAVDGFPGIKQLPFRMFDKSVDD
jgi:hypothetical protein